MVFHCRCFTFSFQEHQEEEEEEIEYETTTQVRSTSTSTPTPTQTFYTASSNFNPSVIDSQPKASVFSNKTSNLRVFTLAELKAATKSFCSKIGEGEIGYVFRGAIKSLEHPFNYIQVVVKCPHRVLQGYKELVTEVNVLGVAEHPNLVKLIGYCFQDYESKIKLFLVYEYMPNKSVEYHLSTRSQSPLSWTMRLKVAQDVARGLAYLHEEMDSRIIFKDFKSSNILLDDQWNAKLSDFGLAGFDPKGVSRFPTMVSRSMGYAAPEYIQTGDFMSKNNVWSYGVFLYELITGRHPLDRSRPENEQKLLEWVKPYIDSKRLQRIIDPRLEGNYSLKSARSLSFIANRCLSINSNSRPKMSEVLEMVNQLITRVPSQPANPAPSLKGLARVVAIKVHILRVSSWFIKPMTGEMCKEEFADLYEDSNL